MNSLLIVEDEKVTRKGLLYLLKSSFGNCSIIEAQNGHEALDQLCQQKFDLILIDISMPKMDGIALLKEIRNQWISQKVLVLTMLESEKPLQKMLAIGVEGYLLKNSPETEIITAIKRILLGKKYFPPKVTEMAIEHLPKTTPLKRTTQTSQSNRKNLSQTEIEILRLIGKDTSIQQIAEELSLPYNTISLEMIRIREKTNSKTDAELVQFAKSFI